MRNWPFMIYKNLLAMLRYRKYAEPQVILTEQQFNSTMHGDKYVKIISVGSSMASGNIGPGLAKNATNATNMAKNSDDSEIPDEQAPKGQQPITILLLSDEPSLLSKKEAFDKLLKNIETNKSGYGEVLIVSEQTPARSVQNAKEAFIAANKKITFRLVHYAKFMNNMAEKCSKHEILTEEELEAEYGVYIIDKHNLAKILFNDTMVIWLGANTGDIIKIGTTCSNVAISTTYKIVTN